MCVDGAAIIGQDEAQKELVYNKAKSSVNGRQDTFIWTKMRDRAQLASDR